LKDGRFHRLLIGHRTGNLGTDSGVEKIRNGNCR